MKILHTSIAVKDMDESISFYCGVLGFELLRRRERPKSMMEKRPESRREIAFIGDEDGTQIEFTCWKDREYLASGDELDHIALAVPNMDEAMKTFKAKNVDIVREPFTRQGSTGRTAFVRDPNGIWLEIIERKQS